jgi:uncharacterized membrane protein
MNDQTAPRSIEQYLAELRAALAGEDPALIQDALYDAEEYLRAEVAANPGRSESDTLELIASTYGAPEEVALAYRTTEKQVRTALAPPPRVRARTAFGRFFGVYGDSRTWTALFYMLLALVTGVFYFTMTVAGLSMSVGLAMLIIGIPFFLLFVGFTRVLSLAEGLLGQRMPRRPLYPAKGVPIFERIRDMLVDRRTWTTMLYFLLMLPLGIFYFVIAVVGICVSIGLIGGSIAGMLLALNVGTGSWMFDDHAVSHGTELWATPFLLIAGIVLLTAVMHLVRAIGRGHGTFAKHLLVARADDNAPPAA